MDSLQAFDVSVFRYINGTLSNRVCDANMPLVSGNALFFPFLIVAAIALVWKGRTRGIVCLLMLALIVSLDDGWICRELKNAVARPRPFLALADVHCLIGKGGSFSMPSSHAANWFAATMVLFVYYRRSLWLTLPLALLVSFSRVYNGVHYPSDVLAGAIVGAGFAAAALWLLSGFWQWAGHKWFPLWHERLPSLLEPVLIEPSDEPQFALRPSPLRPGAQRSNTPPPTPRHASVDQHWLRVGYIFVVALLALQIWYISTPLTQLAEDESYQWLWSKHLALSYFSKPPLIAHVQFLGTFIWGDTAFGVRFFSPVIAAILSLLVLRFFARELNARAGFFLLLIVSTTPLMAAGTSLMTVDPLSVLFWTAAMVTGWRAVRLEAGSADSTRYWLWTGLWMGLGCLSKYTELLQWLCWVVFFILWSPGRKHLRRAGPYLALLVNLLCSTPVLIWNAQRGWPTVKHVALDAGAGQPWQPTLRYFLDFVGSEIGLLNPIFFVAACWAAIVFWRRNRHNPLLLYFFSMGVPLFLVYLGWSFHSRVLANWIAPSVLPIFCLMVAYWDTRLRLNIPGVKRWLFSGVALGLGLVLLAHNTDWLGKFTGGRLLPVNLDPLHRVRCWSDVARIAGQARNELAAEGKPTFIICDHYGLVGEISFYLPEAKAVVKDKPLVYYKSSPEPLNQFYYWPGYTDRTGENAVFIREVDREDPKALPIPEILREQFESVTDLGIRNVMYHGRIIRPLQVVACRNLR